MFILHLIVGTTKIECPLTDAKFDNLDFYYNCMPDFLSDVDRHIGTSFNI